MNRVVSLLLVLIFAAPAVFAKTIRLRIVHTNDIHGWMMARPEKKQQNRMIGGAAALASVIKSERKKGPTLALDAGDWFQGTPEGSLPRGAAMAEIFNAIGHDAVVLGNHEFDYGQDVIEELVAKVSVPVLGANVTRASTEKTVEYVSSSILKTVGGVKVGIFGLVTSNVPNLVFPNSVSGLVFENEILVAQRLVADLKERGAEIIIGLNHVGQEGPDRPPFEGDRALAAAVPGIDVIVGGHTHDAIPIPRPEPSGTLIVNAGSYLKTVGVVTLDFDTESHTIISKSGEVRNLWLDEVGEDPEIKKIVERYEQKIGRELDVVISRAEVDLPQDRKRLSPAGAWLTDCVRKWTKTDVVIQNAGGLRSGLSKGPVRYRNMFEVMPFDNYLTTLYMKGSSILKALEHGVSFAPHIVQFSGLEMTWDDDRPRGKRVQKVMVRGRRLRDNETYSVTASDFMINGGDGDKSFAEGVDKVTTRDLVRDVLSWCARRYSPITMPDLSRVKRK